MKNNGKKLLQISLSQELIDIYTTKIVDNNDKLDGLQVNVEENNVLDITAKVKAGFLPMKLNGKADLQRNVHFDYDDTFRVKLIDFNIILRLLAPALNSEKSKRMGVSFNTNSINVRLKQFFRNSNLPELNELISTIEIRSKKGSIKLKALGEKEKSTESEEDFV